MRIILTENELKYSEIIDMATSFSDEKDALCLVFDHNEDQLIVMLPKSFVETTYLLDHEEN